MELGHWLSLLSICLLGAMSPGPSLAVVVKPRYGGGAPCGLPGGTGTRRWVSPSTGC